MLSYGKITDVADSKSQVFAVADGAMYSISKKDPEDVRFYDRANGMSEVNISKIAYDPNFDLLLIYYKDGNIDFLTADKIGNLTAIRDNSRLKSKEIKRIIFGNGKIYLAGGFGISVIDESSQLVIASYFQGKEVSDMAVTKDGKLWALTNNQILEGDEKNNLQDPYYWHEIDIQFEESLKADKLAISGGNPVVGYNNGSLIKYPLKGGNKEIVCSYETTGKKVTDIDYSPNGYFALAETDMYILKPQSDEIRKIDARWPLHVSSNTSEQIVWGAYAENGIGRMDLAKDNLDFKTFKLNDKSFPRDNQFFNMISSHGKLYAVSGGFDVNRLDKPFEVKIFNGREWSHITQKEVGNIYDASFITVDPKDSEHFFVSTHGWGLVEFRSNKLYKIYDQDNSALGTAQNNGKGYCRVGPTAFDSEGNLWIAECDVPGSNILVLKTNGEWTKVNYPCMSDDNSYIQMLRMPNGTTWLSINHASTGLYVFDASKATLASPANAQCNYINGFSDRSGKLIPQKRFKTMALDKNGVMWLGSENGLSVVAGASSAYKQIPLASRPVGGEEPNLFYILDNIQINGIQVDRLNNKWIATSGEGLYLMNDDCTKLLRHYTVDNSPILSNNINSIALDELNGRLYVYTDIGLMALETGSAEATKESLSNVYAYPNPLRPDNPDKVTIAGLNIGCEIKIIDSSGQIVFETTSVDDHVIWPARYSNGERVASGVYQILIYAPEQKKSTKIGVAVIK